MMIRKKILGRIELFETLTIFFHVLVFAFFNFSPNLAIYMLILASKLAAASPSHASSAC